MLMHEFDRGEGGWREEHRHIPPGSNGKCQNIHTRNITKDVTDHQENLRDTMLDDCIDKNGEHHVNTKTSDANPTKRAHEYAPFPISSTFKQPYLPTSQTSKPLNLCSESMPCPNIKYVSYSRNMHVRILCTRSIHTPIGPAHLHALQPPNLPQLDKTISPSAIRGYHPLF
jgi:hypothetical protein